MVRSMMKNILLTIAYDGSGFHGWQKQLNTRTIQGTLEDAMSKLFGREILLNGTSRTDAGVHALGQRASFKTDIGIPTEKIPLVVNNALCAAEGRTNGRGGFAKSPIRILKAEEMPDDFHARFNTKGKLYIYRIRCNGNVESDYSLIFERNYIYHVNESLDTEAMNEAAKLLLGTHDFKSFEAAGGNPRETTVRTISRAEVLTTGKNEDIIELHISGDGFLYNMVRIITGTLVEVGQGKRRAADMTGIIEAKDRTLAAYTAPPNGLYLAKVYY